jgi:hypothetical protein
VVVATGGGGRRNHSIIIIMVNHRYHVIGHIVTGHIAHNLCEIPSQ